jgi:transcriptional regulator with XRE-family HTH domain
MKPARTEEETRVSRTVGENVHRLRRRAGLTATALAEKLTASGQPINPHQLRALEKGEHHGGVSYYSVSVDRLVALAAILGTTPCALLGDHGRLCTAREAS